MSPLLFPVFALLALALLAEYGERQSRRYYQDQWFLRGSGFFLGCAVTLIVVFLAL